ncbi:MAG: fibro-slime domain-containing protein [Oscillospiraceae bacterium]|nr:fibro-slime domain-containing protein [Oscillospiraceae bacterium]
MQDDLQEQTRSRAAAQTRRRKRRIWVAGLCCAVAAATAYALTRPALTMTQQTFCGQEAHTHDESCYETILICGQDEQLPVEQPTPHVHTEGCYAASLVLVCGQEESEEHTHTEDCCQTQYKLICSLEEGEAEDEPEIPAHVHTDACYETRLICEKPEHTHSLSCYADAQADLESASVWEQTIPQTLSGQWRADVVAVAESQLGYAASTRNYIVDEAGGMHGYTRYGAWYGSPYGEWCAMFASFCLHYAGVPEDSIPAQAGCIRWTEQLQALGRYAAAGAAAPQPGDLVFFDTGSDGYADHVALVAEVSADGTSLTTIEGNVGGCVVRKQHALDEAGLLGFGILPEQEDGGETPDEPAEPETPARTPLCGHEEHAHTADCYDETGTLICALEEHTHTDACYEPAAEKTPLCGHEAHTHTADCYDETGALICTLEEHTHTDACYEPAAEKTPLCGLEEHTHTEDCYSADGTLVCELPEHTHTDACYEAASTQRFSYADAQLQLTLTVESAQPLPEGTELDVQATDAAVFSGLSDGEASDGTEQWIVRQLALVQSDEALDTAAYRMTAEIAVTDAVLQPLLGQLDARDEAAPEAETGVTLAVMQAGDEGLQELDSATISAEEAAPVFTVSVQSGTIAVLATTANPSYTVQYYAYIPRFATNGETALTVFDTSGRVLPTNVGTNKTKSIYLTPTGQNTTKNAGNATPNYHVATTDELTQMYTANEFEYIKAPNPSYINKLIDNSSYELKEIWVLKEGGREDSTEDTDWIRYTDPSSVHFTNRDLKDEDGAGAQNIIYLDSAKTKRNVLRLVYDTKEADFTTSATFYDYNISSGQNGDGKWRTGITGINSASNYGMSRNGARTWKSYCDVLAFGNANCGTGMANYKFANIYLNRHSGQNFGCTFGLVDSLSGGKIVYNEWLVAPNLFNEGNANGKKSFENSSLTFSQVGDTYTLSSASVGTRSISGLQDFFNPSPKPGTTHTHIFTNDFWPLDDVSYTDIQMDPKFGSYSNPIYYQGFASADGISGTWGDESTTLPYSDDGRAHNSFFGMQYAVTFTLTPDYVGPLDYTFFGDDDMWVFLDDTLVCDIGGVHSSVGEYVNLWDYIRTDRTKDEQHTLTFFYTERGASGSTCYMNFTLPSVSGVNIEQKTGDLEIRKQVIGEDDPHKEFTFGIMFTDANGSRIWDDYAYTRTKNDGSTETDLVLHNGSQFSLKAGETIRIKYLPIGLRYEITELDPGGYTVTNTVDGVLSGGGTAQGTIIKDVPGTVVFTNTMEKVGLTLQKLDQDGNPLKDAVFELRNAAGEVVWAVRKTEGGSTTYTVPSSGANQIQSGALYYIALAEDLSFVIGQNSSLGQNDAQLQKKTGSSAQKMYVVRQTDGSYSFRCEENKRYLDLDSANLEDGHLVHFYPCENGNDDTPHTNQKWYLIANGDGTFKIKPRVAVLAQSKAVLDLSGATIAEGQRIQVWTDNGSSAQKWLLVPVEEEAAPETTKDLAVDDGGVLRLAGLLPGSYTLTETQAPDGYQKLSQPISFRVGAGGTITLADGTITDAIVANNGILQVRNRHEDLTLTLRKELVNSQSTQAFPFTVSYTADGQTFRQELALANGASGKLQIPYGAEVTITETAHDGFAVTFKSGETLLSSGDSYTFKMTADAAITAFNAAGYALPGTGGGALWLQLAGAALVLLTLPAYNWIKTKKQKAKGRTRP